MINDIMVSRILLPTQKRISIFAHWIIFQNEKLPVQSHERFKAQFITIVTGNSNRDGLYLKSLV